MIEQFNIWFFGTGVYEVLGGFAEFIALIGLAVFIIVSVGGWLDK
jgi:Co/Zn/Cd efflux system component